MKATYKQVQQAVARHYPDTIYYEHGRPVMMGEGRKKQKCPRRVGRSHDYLFSVEIIKGLKNVRQVAFMIPAFPEVVEKFTAVIGGIIGELHPQWEGAEWLRDTAVKLQDQQSDTQGQVTVSKAVLKDVPVVFVKVT